MGNVMSTMDGKAKFERNNDRSVTITFTETGAAVTLSEEHWLVIAKLL